MGEVRELVAVEDEFGIRVSHTSDPVAAARFLETWHNPECMEYFPHERGPECSTYSEDPAAGRVVWYRWVPGCPEWCRGFRGEPVHRGHLYDAKPHARGAFPSVEWWSGP